MNQNQNSGDNSKNIQIGTVNVDGISFSEARQIAVDVMKAELSHLTKEAEVEAQIRIANYADNLMDRLRKKPELLVKFKEPRTQISVRDAHLLHVKRGTDDVTDLSIDMLIDFISRRGDDFKAVVLDDAIRVTHSLTSSQIDSLTILLIIRHYEIKSKNILEWSDKMRCLVEPFIQRATRSDSQLDYLVGIGCADLEVINQTFGHFFNMRYSTLSVDHFQENQSSDITPEDVEKVTRNFKSILKRNSKVKVLNEYFDNHSAVLKELQRYFNGSKLAKMNLRIVGRAIGYANLRRRFPSESFNDSIWYKD